MTHTNNLNVFPVVVSLFLLQSVVGLLWNLFAYYFLLFLLLYVGLRNCVNLCNHILNDKNCFKEKGIIFSPFEL